MKSKPFVEPARALVGCSDLQRGPICTEMGGLIEDVTEDGGAHAAAAETRQDSDVVDVDFVEHEPEGAESGDAAPTDETPEAPKD